MNILKKGFKTKKLMVKGFLKAFVCLMFMLPLIAMGITHAASLDLGTTSGNPGDKVTVPVILNYDEGKPPNIIYTRNDIEFDANVLENPTAKIGPSTRAAGKLVVGAEVGTGKFRVIAFGLTKNSVQAEINAGIVAYVTFSIKSDASIAYTTLTNTPRASDKHGTLILDPEQNPEIITTSEVIVGRQQEFSDVLVGYWAENYINQIYYNKLTTRYPDSTYRPQNNVTRAEMAAFLIRASVGEDFTYKTEPYFSDTSSDHWAFKYIQKLRELGKTTGYPDSTYRPQNNVTRAEMAAFLIRASVGEDFTYKTELYFSDTSSDHWAFKYIQKLRELGKTTGYPDSTYRPQNNVTRAEMAAFITRTFLQYTTTKTIFDNGILSTDKNIIVTTYQGSSNYLILSKVGTSYSTADLKGKWIMHGLCVSNATNGWEYGNITVAHNRYTGTIQFSDESPEEVTGTISIDEYGYVTVTGIFDNGIMSADKNMITAAYTSGKADYCMYILTKKGTCYTNDDLAGTWIFHELETNPTYSTDNEFSYGTSTVASDYGYTGTIQSSYGASEEISGTISIDENGKVTVTSEGDTIFENGIMSADKNMITATYTGSEGRVNIITIVKKRTDYSVADLVGSWVGDNLWLSKSSSDDNGWSYIYTTVYENGSFWYAGIDSDENTWAENGTISVDSKGKVSLTVLQ